MRAPRSAASKRAFASFSLYSSAVFLLTGILMASRGRPKVGVVSYITPTREDLSKVSATVFTAAPIAAAILGAALIEHELDTLLRRRFPKITDSNWSSMVSEGAPFSTFDQKITAAFAFRMFDEATKSNLKIIKSIRNVFAHSRMLIDFDHKLITDELKRIKIPGFKKAIHREVQKVEHGGQHSYTILCMTISTHLTQKYITSLKATNKRFKRKQSDIYRALMGSFSLPDKFGELSPRSLPQIHSGDPIHPVQGGLLSALSQYFDQPHKTGKK